MTIEFLKKDDAYNVSELADHVIQLESEVDRLIKALRMAENGIGEAHSRIQSLEDKVSQIEEDAENLEVDSE